MNPKHRGGDMSTKIWVDLPNRERIRIHQHWLGAIIIAFEPPSHPNQVHVLKGIVPVGTVGQRSFFAYLQEADMANDFVEAPHSFHFRGHQLRIDATLEEYSLFGFIPMPKWLVQAIHVTLWVDGVRYREFVF
jgi:hypothetical protein